MRSTMKQKKKHENHDKLQNNNHHNVNELEQLSYTKAFQVKKKQELYNVDELEQYNYTKALPN